MFTKPLVRQIGSEIEKAVQEIAEKHNIGISYNGGSVSMLDSTVKLKLIAKGEEAEVQNGVLAKSLGLPEDIIGMTFTERASIFTIERIDMNKIKYPIIAKNQNGNPYKFTVDSIKRHLNL